MFNKKRKGSWNSPSSFLLFLYLVSAILAIPVVYMNGFEFPFSAKDYWIPMFIFVFCLFCFLIPFCSFKETKVDSIYLPPRRILNLFSNFIIGISLFSIFFFSSSVKNIFQQNLLEARTALYGGELYVEAGLPNTIASVGASLYVFAILLFFIYGIIGDSPKRMILLLISSISEPLHILSYVGRDGVVFWIFSFIFLFLFFKPYMSEDFNLKIRKYIVIISFCLLVPIIAISMSRFGESDSGTGGSVINYIGQSFVNGMLYMGIEEKPFTEGAGFPLFYEITGIKQTIVREVGGGMLQIGEWKSWWFSTFVVSLYTNLSFLGLMIFAFCSFLVQRFALVIRHKSINFSQLFIYLLFFQMYSQGVFYFKQYTRGGNLFIVLCFLFYLFFDIWKNKSNMISKNA
jgi:oligosaccharide repeat unit polymerase